MSNFPCDMGFSHKFSFKPIHWLIVSYLVHWYMNICMNSQYCHWSSVHFPSKNIPSSLSFPNVTDVDGTSSRSLRTIFEAWVFSQQMGSDVWKIAETIWGVPARHGGTPIAGWMVFVREHLEIQNGWWFGGSPIYSGNHYIHNYCNVHKCAY